ncbi:WAP, Kazal, immunoglobulin, Kunitz and NTR domain-containing protein 1-like [Stegostoma tigrinum]|uniref:WAP, Kazal, immunoglobulin, Kunitz and NTR domain-containing protein 1-like n=1 Tax=Stegostoma tigrinum TaxID=3053191 RepID=UPI0028700A05|nr:WAP, Kazal, immunoglobulin, Kunitz and NTR domain-containing protein 1-like [Stegostoma tigrinum]
MLAFLHRCAYFLKCCQRGLGLLSERKAKAGRLQCRTLVMVLGLLRLTAGASLTRGKLSYPGACPNQLNPNLWVDAQSTCERECNIDEDCQSFEKCCTNVCGLKSCVAARFADGSLASLDLPKEATCERIVCTQQGSECDIWDGQPICKCKDRCEKEPNFTCASDGLTYYNKCYMDAEACIRGISLTVVTCRYHITWPNTSPQPLETTVNPTSTTSLEDSIPPALYTNPFHQSVYVGGTVSFHCDVSGRPRPDITWEKQSDYLENIIMRPDQMYANVVVTNIGQLVIYNTQQEDAGIYTCTARNAAGLLRADFPLSVIRREHSVESPARKTQPLPSGECFKDPDKRECGRQYVRWFYDHKMGRCSTFMFGGCEGSKNQFETYEECRLACINESVNICTFPAVQGPCKMWEARWAYNSLMKQCHAFVYGGCEGNKNNFESKEVCEETCPFPKSQQCKVCRPRHKIVPSFCRSDYAIVGRVTEIVEEQDSGVARFTLDEVLKDEKMGLKFFDFKHLEVIMINMDWNCPCPNINLTDGPLLVMGDVYDGMAVLDAESYVRTVTDKRIKKMYEIIEKKTCELLHRFQD